MSIIQTPLTEAERANFETICEAYDNGDLVVVRSVLKETGEPVALVCATYLDQDNMVQVIPLAQMISGNPYDPYEDPTTDA